MLTQTSARNSWTLRGKSVSVSCGDTVPFSWILVHILDSGAHSGVHKILFLSSRSLFPQSCGSYIINSHCPPNSNFLGVLSPFVDPQFGKSVVGPRTFLKVLEFLWCNCAVCEFLLSSALVRLNWFGDAEYSYLLLVCKALYLPTEHEWHPYSVEYSYL